MAAVGQSNHRAVLAVLAILLCYSVIHCKCFHLHGDVQVENGRNATVTWHSRPIDTEYLSLGENEEDEVRLYCGEGSDVRYSKTLNDDHIARWSVMDVLVISKSTLPSVGTVNIGPFINMRDKCQVIFWRYSNGSDPTRTHDGNLVPLFPNEEEPHLITVGSGSVQPMQGHLAMTSDISEMHITWVSADVSSRNPAVYYRQTDVPGDAINIMMSSASATTYSAGDMCGSVAGEVEGKHFRSPGMIYTATMTELKPNTNYTYWYGTGTNTTNGLSPVHWFISPKPTAVSPPSARIIALADMGAWGGSNPKEPEWQSPIPVVVQSMLLASEKKSVDLVTIYGDISYANGKGYVWERFFYRLEPLATRVPVHVAVGNHEYDYISSPTKTHRDPSGLTTPYHPSWGNLDGGSSHGECAVPTAERFKMPSSPGSNGVFWYSHNVANVHMVVISTEHDISPGSTQARWLEQDLAGVNRNTQPWVIVGGHRSLYDNVQYSNADVDLPYQIHGRRFLNPLFAKYKVNVFIAGHYHNYVRTCPMDSLSEQCVQYGGTTYITVGTGGAGLEPNTFSKPYWVQYNMTGSYGFVLFESTSDEQAEITFIASQTGQVMDRTTITRSSPGTSVTQQPQATNSSSSPGHQATVSVGTLVGISIGFLIITVLLAVVIMVIGSHKKPSSAVHSGKSGFSTLEQNEDV